MHLNQYFESLNFESGNKINVSSMIDANFIDKTHWHPYIEMLLNLQDNNEITINFNKYVLKPNDLVMIFPGDLHSVGDLVENTFVLVQFPIELLMIMNEFNSNFSIFRQYHYLKYDPSNIDSDKMIFLVKELSELHATDNLFKEVQMYSILLEFFVRLGKSCVNAKKKEFTGDLNAEDRSTMLMAEACLYISQNCTKPLTLDDVSHYLGISKYYFSHLFKEHTNLTFIDFLTAERIKRTELSLLNSKARMIDIAFDSGFSSLSSFNRAFKKAKGISPSEFRERVNDFV